MMIITSINNRHRFVPFLLVLVTTLACRPSAAALAITPFQQQHSGILSSKSSSIQRRWRSFRTATTTTTTEEEEEEDSSKQNNNNDQNNPHNPIPRGGGGGEGGNGIFIGNRPPKSPSFVDFRNFALPCLGLWVAQPLLSLVDTSFVGLSSSNSAQQLAALGPATTLYVHIGFSSGICNDTPNFGGFSF
jgi:hypothetical protein